MRLVAAADAALFSERDWQPGAIAQLSSGGTVDLHLHRSGGTNVL